MVTGCCEKPTPVESYDAKLHAKITACSSCNTTLDSRPLRPKDEPSDERDPLVEERRMVDEEAGRRVAPEGIDFPNGEPVLCTLHGGPLEPCDERSGKAHHCSNSRFMNGPCAGPCACYECHALVGKCL